MRARFVSWAILSAIACAPLAATRVARAQVNLPPPPPPPIDNTQPTSTGGGATTSPSHRPKPPPPKHTAEPAHTTAPPPERHEQREPQPAPRPEPAWSPRTISIRLNPLPFFISRLSADFEIMLAPHHALVASPNFTLHKFAFHRSDLIGYGLGYASDDSSGFGAEIGYHYWTKRELEGIFFGPSLLLGGTFPPPGGKTFGYVGGAVDVGYQYLFPSGFTLEGGGGIMLIGGTTAGATAKAVPRLLFGVGWSF